MTDKPMAFQWMEAAMESDLPAPARHVFMVIAKRDNHREGCIPFLCLSSQGHRLVQGYLDSLWLLGLINT